MNSSHDIFENSITNTENDRKSFIGSPVFPAFDTVAHDSNSVHSLHQTLNGSPGSISSGEVTFMSLDESLAHDQLHLIQQITSAKLGLVTKDRLIAKLQKEGSEKDKIILELRNRIEETANVNTRNRRPFHTSGLSSVRPPCTADFSAQTPSDFLCTADFSAQTPGYLFSSADAASQIQSCPPVMSPEALNFCLQLQHRVGQLEEKFLDWEEGKMHDMFIRVFRDDVRKSHSKSSIDLEDAVPSSLNGRSPPSAPPGAALPNVVSGVNPTVLSLFRPSSIVGLAPAPSAVSRDAAVNSVVHPPLNDPASTSNNNSVPASASASSATIGAPASASDSAQSPPSSTKSVLVIGDSIIKHLNCQSDGVKFFKKCLKGSSIPHVSEFIKNFSSPDSYDVIYIHCGTNSVNINKFGFISNSTDILEYYSQLFSIVSKKFPSSQVIISGILFRRDLDYTSLCCINDFIHDLCRSFGFFFVNPSSRLTPSVLGRDGLHLNRSGSFHFKKLVTSTCLELLFGQQKN